MTRDYAKELIPIIIAFANGETIQFHHINRGWNDIESASFYYDPSRYRIKPKPMEFTGRVTEVTTDYFNHEASITISIPFISNHQSAIVGGKFKVTEILGEQTP